MDWGGVTAAGHSLAWQAATKFTLYLRNLTFSRNRVTFINKSIVAVTLNIVFAECAYTPKSGMQIME